MTEEKTKQKSSLTQGAIFAPLIKFMLPVFCATFLQAMYAAVDLVVVGHFVDDVNASSSVGTGGMIMTLITYVIQGLTTGITVTLGGISARKTGRAQRALWARQSVFSPF